MKSVKASSIADSGRRAFLFGIGGLSLSGALTSPSNPAAAKDETMVIDDFSDPGLVSTLGTAWGGFSDQVMGGVSEVSVIHASVDGRLALQLSGDVKLDNNGGFVQAGLNLSGDNGVVDASRFKGVRLAVRGNGESYSVHLRTRDTVRPWQSYRAQFRADPKWSVLELPFVTFAPYRLDTPLDQTRLRRIGLVAIGRSFRADLAVSSLAFYS